MAEEKPPEALQPVQHHFVCIPYLSLRDIPEIVFSFATIWNFDKMKEKYIPDATLRAHVESILKNYRNSYPHMNKDGMDAYSPLRGIGIVSTSRQTAQPIDKEDREKINDARLMLFISFLSSRNTITRNMNTGHSMASSENYSPVYFTAVVGTTYMTEQSGFVVPGWYGGLDINKNILIKPKHIPTPDLSLDNDLIGALSELRTKHPRVFRRIISAVDVFFESFYNSPEVSHNARILLQSSAFEILFNTGPDEIRTLVKAFLKKEATTSADKQVSYKSARRRGFAVETGTMKEKWADRFFTLRNRITHGKIPKAEEYLFGTWQRHFDIALYFFIFCLKRKLEKTLKKIIFHDDVEWTTWTEDLEVPPRKYTGFEYKHYGRRGWLRLLKKVKK